MDVNDTACQTLGYDRDELLRMSGSSTLDRPGAGAGKWGESWGKIRARAGPRS